MRPSPSPWDLDGPEALIPLPEQFANHDEYRPPATAALAGRTFDLDVDGVEVAVTFPDAARLRWSTAADGGEDAYEAVAVRDGVWAVTVARLADGVSALVVLDEHAGRGLANVTRFSRAGAGARVREITTYHQVGIGGPPSARIAPTEELVGRRVAHRYSSTHLFEHTYLNPNSYVFQGLAGPEAGVSDLDRADYYKLGTDLYLFSWHERMQPFNGAVVLDFASGRATGRLVGHDAGSDAVLQVRTGSEMTVLSTIDYRSI
jgi:hypothetical protein